MKCVVTAGPTYEPLDDVRRLTNFSTGQLGCELASYLTGQGHTVTLLLGEHATYCGERKAWRVEKFTTTADLRKRLRALAGKKAGAVFHAAAVSDFRFGKVWLRTAGGEMRAMKQGKISTREERGTLLAELVATPKILAELREWFPKALLVGWKYEVDGGRRAILEKTRRQLEDCRTDACVANGPAYGDGFGLVRNNAATIHLKGRAGLLKALGELMGSV